jgi:hypothetical protein
MTQAVIDKCEPENSMSFFFLYAEDSHCIQLAVSRQ